jgi:hypothetical protein
MARYRLSEKAIKLLQEKIKTPQGASQLMGILNLKERQIQNLINDNAQILTIVSMVEYIKDNGIKSESLILDKIK